MSWPTFLAMYERREDSMRSEVWVLMVIFQRIVDRILEDGSLRDVGTTLD